MTSPVTPAEEATLPDPPTTESYALSAADTALRTACLAQAAGIAAAGHLDPLRVTGLAALLERYVRTGRATGDATGLLVDHVSRLRKGAHTLQIQIPAGFDAKLSIAPPVDVDGQPTTFGGPVTWASANPELFAAAASQDDGMVGLITTVVGGPEGDGVVHLSAPAGTEADAATLTNDVQVSVIPGDAQALNPAGVELLRKQAA